MLRKIPELFSVIRFFSFSIKNEFGKTQEKIQLDNGAKHSITDVTNAYKNIQTFYNQDPKQTFISALFRHCNSPSKNPIHPAFKSIFRDFGMTKGDGEICPVVKDVTLSSFKKHEQTGYITFNNPLEQQTKATMKPR